MLAGVPSTNPSASSTSTGDAVRAGRTRTSTPSISSVPAPASTASSRPCSAGDVVWWTTSRTGTSARPVRIGDQQWNLGRFVRHGFEPATDADIGPRLYDKSVLQLGDHRSFEDALPSS